MAGSCECGRHHRQLRSMDAVGVEKSSEPPRGGLVEICVGSVVMVVV